MRTRTWTYENHSEALAAYRSLIASGCKARIWLAYAGEGWKVSVAGA
jgi:hypothetical protein